MLQLLWWGSGTAAWIRVRADSLFANVALLQLIPPIQGSCWELSWMSRLSAAWAQQGWAWAWSRASSSSGSAGRGWIWCGLPTLHCRRRRRRWELLFRASGVCGPLRLCVVACSSQEACGCLVTVCFEWFSVYSEIIGVLGLVLLSSFTIMLFLWLYLWVTNVLLHFCNAEIKVLTFFQFHWMQFL